MITSTKIIQHITAAVAAAKYEPEPFGHFYIRGFLPDKVYWQLLEALPKIRGHYTPLDLVKYARQDGTPTREQLVLGKLVEGDLLAEPEFNILKPLYDALSSEDLKMTVFRKLGPALAERFGFNHNNDHTVWPTATADIRAMRDTEDYEILPHRDTMYKLVTMQLYLPKDFNMRDKGTSLFVPADIPEREINPLAVKSVWETFKEVKRFDFVPNSAYAFVVSKGPKYPSWHGVRKLSEFKGERNTLMVIYENRLMGK